MQYKLLETLRCPITRTRLTVKIIKETTRVFDGKNVTIIDEGILFAESDWFFPIIKGIPRLCVEAFLDYEDFLKANLDDYTNRKENLQLLYGDLLKYVLKKNKRTKESFTKEWGIYNYEIDKTWDADNDGMLARFLKETNEAIDTLQNKIIFDAGCGNGKLNCLLAAKGINNVAMDFSNSIEAAYAHSDSSRVFFIQGDVQFPPVSFNSFDIVHSSGVLICTNNTELSFSCLVPIVKDGGKLSIWSYHPRENFIHNLFNSIRSVTSKLPLQLQYFLYAVTIFPVSYCMKKIKRNPQNAREMMIDILDWFTPEFRWEHGHQEITSWYYKRQFNKVKITTNELFGFNIIGEKNGSL